MKKIHFYIAWPTLYIHIIIIIIIVVTILEPSLLYILYMVLVHTYIIKRYLYYYAIIHTNESALGEIRIYVEYSIK